MRLRATDPGGRGSELSMTFQVQGALVTGCSAVGGAWPLGVLMYVLAARRRRPRRGT